MKRVSLDIIMVLVTLGLLLLHSYIVLPAVLQLLVFKALLVSAGILHAHLTRKLIFPKLDWKAEKLTAGHIVSIVFYIVIVYAYAIGG